MILWIIYGIVSVMKLYKMFSWLSPSYAASNLTNWSMTKQYILKYYLYLLLPCLPYAIIDFCCWTTQALPSSIGTKFGSIVIISLPHLIQSCSCSNLHFFFKFSCNLNSFLLVLRLDLQLFSFTCHDDFFFINFHLFLSHIVKFFNK